jgi:hypothetical protein
VTLETVALWWCYAFGAVAALALLAVTLLYAIDRVTHLFKVSRIITEWAWYRAKGYEIYKPEITTPKPNYLP